jgi:hypothetical protein
MARQTGADPEGVFTTTPNITTVNVTVANGIANVQIVDNSAINNPQQLQGRAITYFVEFATDSGFVKIFHHEAWHSVRNQNVFVGNQTFYVRAYSQLQGSAPSQPVASPQNPLTGGGVAPPTQQTYQGSGNSSIGAAGYGTPLRSLPRNPRLNLP